MPDLRDRLTARRSYWEPLPEDLEVEQYFTDAEEARRAFDALVAAEALARRVLVIHGVGGVGKSTLLQMYRLFCYRRGLPVAIVAAEDAPSSLDVLTRWAKDLGGMGVKLRRFAGTLEHYRALQVKVEKEARKTGEVLKGAAGELGKAAVQALVTVAATTAGVGPEIASMGGAGIGVAVEWLNRLLGKPDLELYMEPADRLAADFVQDLEELVRRQRIVLMVDTYEQMKGLDRWVCNLAQQLPQNVLLVIAGRELPNWGRAWRSWKKQAEIVEVSAMIGEDRHRLVRNYYAYLCGDQPAPELIEGIAQFARGLPLAATTAVELWDRHGIRDLAAVQAEVMADVVDRLLAGVPSELRAALEAASVLRSFNADLLRALLDREDAEGLYEELRRWPFTRYRGKVLAVHDSVRDAIHETLATRSLSRLKALHRRAAGYYEARSSAAFDQAQESATVEMLYHALRADEGQGVALLEERFAEAERLSQGELLNKLLQEAEQYTFLQAESRHRVQYLRARLAREWPERERLFRALLNEELDDALRPRVLRGLAEALSSQRRSKEANAYLRQALELCERLGDPIEAAWTRLELSWRVDPEEFRGMVELAFEAFHRAGDEYGMAIAELELGYYYINRRQAKEAREAFTRSLARQQRLGHRRDAALAQERIGQSYLIEGDFTHATAHKEEALKVFEELEDDWAIAWTLDYLVNCRLETGRWAQGLAEAEQEAQIFGKWRDLRAPIGIAKQGDFYRLQGRFDRALEAYRSAGEGHELDAWSTYYIYAGRGHIHLARQEWDQARESFARAIAVFQAGGRVYEAVLLGSYLFGRLYLAEGCWEEAYERLAACLDAARSKGAHAFECMSLILMAEACYRQGRLEQIKVLHTQAENLGQEYGYHRLLADIHLLRGHIALSTTPAQPRVADPVISFYRASLKHAICYNRFTLDRTLEDIIAHCREQGEKGQQILFALRDAWQTGNNEEGISLLEAERAAREQEPGDGSPQVSVIERIEQALEQWSDAV